jgi:pimeloyl-ACP methyl ester carboxylesterase
LPEATATATTTPTATAEPAATVTPTPTPEPGTELPRFEEAACEFEVPEGRDVECGYLIVAEDRDDPANERTISLHVAIFASESSQPADEPVVYLEGGPGGDALEAIPFAFEDRFSPFLADYTFIMFDQRGTGYSSPSLACPENTELMLELLDDILTDEEAQAENLEMLGECRARLLDEGVNLDIYNSAESAADVDDLRRALGYEQLNLYGISYGTRLAQTVMRDFPEGVRSVILDSSYPIAADLTAELPANASRAFETFFAGCAADPDCAGAFPDLETRFYELVAALDEQPITVPVFYLFDRENYEAALRGDDLISIVFQGLYSAEIIPLLPQLIADVEAGDYELLSTLLSNFILNNDFSSLGMYYAVQCAEEVPFAGEELLDEVENERLRDYYEGGAAEEAEACALWNVPAAAEQENEAVSSDIPTLVLAGEYDPITPPAWGEQVAAALGSATYLEFPGLGHGVSVDHPCPLQITLDFLAAPEDEPDPGCIAEMAGPSFILPGQPEAVTLVPFTENLLGTEYSGVVPDGWEAQGNGAYARQQSSLDQTLLLQQVVVGGNAELFLDLLSDQLGLDEIPASSETYEDAAGREWTLYDLTVQGAPANLALADADGVTYIVMLFSSADEQSFYVEQLFLPALEAIEVSG